MADESESKRQVLRILKAPKRYQPTHHTHSMTSSQTIRALFHQPRDAWWSHGDDPFAQAKGSARSLRYHGLPLIAAWQSNPGFSSSPILIGSSFQRGARDAWWSHGDDPFAQAKGSARSLRYHGLPLIAAWQSNPGFSSPILIGSSFQRGARDAWWSHGDSNPRPPQCH